MKHPARWLSKLLIYPVIALAATTAHSYPDRPITMLVGFAPGGGADTLGRNIAQKMSEILGQTIVVENRPGANSMIAARALTRAKPDGYTILLNAASMSIAAAIDPKLGLDPLADLQPVSLLATYPYLVTVPASLPVNNFEAFIDYAKSQPTGLNYGSSGVGSAPHMGMELLASITGIKMNHVPYKGSSPANIDLAAGRIDAMLTNYLGAAAMIQNQSFRILAVTSAQRAKNLPGVPSVAELGYKDYDVVGWYSLDAPAGTPKDVIDILYKAANKAMLSKEVSAHLAREGTTPVGSTPAEYRKFFEGDLRQWQAVAKQSNISLN